MTIHSKGAFQSERGVNQKRTSTLQRKQPQEGAWTNGSQKEEDNWLVGTQIMKQKENCRPKRMQGQRPATRDLWEPPALSMIALLVGLIEDVI